MAAPVRLGLVGAGRWGRNFIRTIAALPQARLARVASSNPATAALLPEGCVLSADWREIIDAGDLDGVILATPPRLHAAMAARAIEAGLAVLVEKPLTLDATEAGELHVSAVEHDALVMVGHTHLFHPAYRALKALRPSLGPIRRILGEAGNLGPYRPDVPVLWDWGPHDVAMCLDLVGADPISAGAAVRERRVVEGGVGETVVAELAFAGGVHASLRWSNLEPRCRRFTVACDRGTLVYDDLAADKLVVTDEEGRATVVEIARDLPLAVEVAEFAAAIAAKARDGYSLALGVRVVEVLAACEPASARRAPELAVGPLRS